MVNTFLPYPDFRRSAQTLDTIRLNKQINEARNILKALRARRNKDKNIRVGYMHHPATLMWEGYEDALITYIGECVYESLYRRWGRELEIIVKVLPLTYLKNHNLLPPWFGNEEFHKRHRSKLHHKNPKLYPFEGMELFPLQENFYIWPRIECGEKNTQRCYFILSKREAKLFFDTENVFYKECATQ